MAANDGGGWTGDEVMAPVHAAVRGLAAAMANAGAEQASVSLQGNGSAVVRLEYRLWPVDTCEVCNKPLPPDPPLWPRGCCESCGEPLPQEPPAPVQAAAGMVH